MFCTLLWLCHHKDACNTSGLRGAFTMDTHCWMSVTRQALAHGRFWGDRLTTTDNNDNFSNVLNNLMTFHNHVMICDDWWRPFDDSVNLWWGPIDDPNGNWWLPVDNPDDNWWLPCDDTWWQHQQSYDETGDLLWCLVKKRYYDEESIISEEQTTVKQVDTS